MFVEVDGAAEIEGGESAVRISILALGKQFTAQRQVFPEITLQQPAAERIVALAGGGIQGGAATAVGCPRPETLLHPERQPEPGTTVAQAAIGVAGGNFDHGENADLRPAIRFVHEPVFDAEFRIAQAGSAGHTAAADTGHGDD